MASAFLLFVLEVLTIAKLDHQLNEEIRDKEIRLIGADGAQLGIVSAAQANAMAEEQGMDLVKISPNAVPPVCKIMDYSKFCFDQKKREKEAKKNQRVVEIKEIRMSPSIDTNDLNTKVKAAQKFLADGNRVKVSVRFRGREMAHTNLGEKLLMDFADAGVIEQKDYAIFQNKGYQGLYGGLGVKEIHARKGLKKSEKILDHMGSTELAANLFRATQTEEKLRRENIQGKAAANQAHYDVGRKVRQTIQELGGTMPEDLPTPEKSVKQIEREVECKKLKGK